MKSQEAAFRDARKPAPKPKSRITQPRNTATPQRVSKNASRNERRKAARRVRGLLVREGKAVGGKGKGEGEGEGEGDEEKKGEGLGEGEGEGEGDGDEVVVDAEGESESLSLSGRMVEEEGK